MLAKSDDQPSSDSLLSIVTNQRERFKERNVQLEEACFCNATMTIFSVVSLQECGKLSNSNRLLRQEADTLRADNVKLYEKVKFLQCYPSNSSVSVYIQSLYRIMLSQKGVIDDEVVKRYSSDYESNLDPFAAFSSKVRNEIYSKITHHNHCLFQCL